MAQTEANGTQAPPLKAAKPARDGARETGPALELHYRFILWLVPTLDHFPRAQRFLLRLAHDLRYLDRRRYEYAARCLDETGRKIGAWMKAHRARKSPQPV